MAQARYLAVRRMAIEHNVNGCHECLPLAIVEKGTTASICARCHVCETCSVDLEVFDGRLCRRRPGDRVELKWCSFYCPMTAECRPVYVQARSHSCARGGDTLLDDISDERRKILRDMVENTNLTMNSKKAYMQLSVVLGQTMKNKKNIFI